ncbi:hypothetical protein BU23DRAFT_548872 [Bimuria novae-zelandiae CBS 107.79]|uniref:Uncharacterized protein n=1 Tax=Bimuria novae-zelandiae CBS 107.79 TaxID=1447943 RepID=A0A6A5VQQ5_9PLEO|nr:hypothetical protein BU23DRAFT_548872 [Bimuria novae-zelandiae CBS 107.79]
MKTPFEGNPSNGKFRYPVNARQTREGTFQMCAAEAALDKFWGLADTVFRKMRGKCPYDLVKSIVEERTLERTPPWTFITRFPNSAAVTQNAHDVDKHVTGSLNKLSISQKTKVKTRGTTDRQVSNGTSVAEPLNARQEVKIVVDERVDRVFKTLFHSPHSANRPRELSWGDFLHAMVSVGFSVEKLQGSSWHFAAQDGSISRPIQFHEPHPMKNLSFNVARRYGRRLTRAFGCDDDTFTLKE